MLKNAPTLATRGVDTDENEPSKVSMKWGSQTGVPLVRYAVANPARAGELEVALAGPGRLPALKAFHKTNYLVFGLGPVVNGLYDYALVTDPSQLSLYVLTRDLERFEAAYDSDVLEILRKAGFTSFVNKPRKTPQRGCTYTPEPAAALLV